MEIPSNIEVKMSYDSLPVVDEVRFYLSALVRLYIGFLTTGFQRTLILMKTGAGLGVSLHRIWSPYCVRGNIHRTTSRSKEQKTGAVAERSEGERHLWVRRSRGGVIHTTPSVVNQPDANMVTASTLEPD
jgi:hypothetical protein